MCLKNTLSSSKICMSLATTTAYDYYYYYYLLTLGCLEPVYSLLLLLPGSITSLQYLEARLDETRMGASAVDAPEAELPGDASVPLHVPDDQDDDCAPFLLDNAEARRGLLRCTRGEICC